MRRPSATGRFYPGSKRELQATVSDFLNNVDDVERNATGVIAPHAGYPFSGQCAAYSYRAIEPADTYVILGPCHFASTRRPAVSNESWSTPLGEVPVDEQFISELDGIKIDGRPHAEDHAIEVQLPFLQHEFENFEIVPIATGSLNVSGARQLAASIDRAAEAVDQEVRLIASSDLNHYEMQAELEEHDREVYEKILQMDDQAFFKEATSGSVCGFAPILVAMNALNVSEAELLDYRSSCDVTSDIKPGVGYASIALR